MVNLTYFPTSSKQVERRVKYSMLYRNMRKINRIEQNKIKIKK